MNQTCECCGRVPGAEVLVLPPYDELPAEPFLVCGRCAELLVEA